MMPIRDFVGTLAVARKSFEENQQIFKDAYGDKAVNTTQIYSILKKVNEEKLAADKRHLNSKRKKRSLAFIANVAATLRMTAE
jgi:hypothetical protein